MHEVTIPDTMKIGGFDYTILHNNETDKELEDIGNYGAHSEILRRIEISTRISPQQKSLVFIHEILHAIDDIYLAREINNDGTIKKLANGLFQALEQLGVRFVK